MQLKKVTQKNSDGSSISYEFSVPPKQEIPHPGNPKGTDTVPAWLTPGEFVMNAEATRMYKPQIEAMNEQGKAVQRQQGGSIPSYQAYGGKVQYKEEGGFIDWLSSLLGMESVPEKAVQAPAVSQDFYGRPVTEQDIMDEVTFLKQNKFEGNPIEALQNNMGLSLEDATKYYYGDQEIPEVSRVPAPQASVPKPATPNQFLTDRANDQADYMSGTYSLLKEHEGYREKPYKDSRGFWTVGTGHKITDPEVIKKLDAGEEVSFTPEQLGTQLKVDTGKAIVAARNNFKDFDNYPPSLKQALIGMNFQLGEAGTKKFDQMRSAMEAGDWEEAAKQAMDSDWAEQTPTRAKHVRDELLKMGGGETQASTSDVPQIFANAVADEVPSGDYFPSDVSGYAGGRGDYGMVGYNKDKAFYDKTIEDGFRNPDGSLVIPPKGDGPTIDPNAMVDSANRVGLTESPVPPIPEKPVNAYAEALKEQRRVAEEQAKQRETIADAEFIGAREDDVREAKAGITDIDAEIAKTLREKEVAAANGLDTSIHDAIIAELESDKASLQSKQAVAEEDKAQAETEVKQRNLNLEGTEQYDDAALRQQRTQAADEIVKATQEQADAEGLTDEEFTDAIIDDMDNRAREAVTGQPELLDRTMSFFEEYGITDLFDKKEIGKMAMMYIGSRIMGYSHGGSLNFAMKNYATNVQAKQTAKAKEIKDLLEGGKFEPSSIAKYEKSGDINDLVKKGQTFTPTGNTKYVLYRDPKTKKTQRLKVREVKGSDDNGIYYQLPNGQRINDLSPNLRDYKPEMYEGTPEFNTYNQQAAASHLEALNAVVDVEGAKDDDGNLVVPIHPRLAAEAGVNWARAMGLDPKDSRVQAVIRDAYTAALRENKGKELQATELEPYLTRMSIMQEEQRPQLYERMDSDGKPTGKYISPVDLASIRAMVKEETSEIMKRRSTSVTTKQIWDYAAAQWESLGPEGQEKYHKAALDGDSSGFAKYLEEQLNANKYDRIVGQSK